MAKKEKGIVEDTKLEIKVKKKKKRAKGKSLKIIKTIISIVVVIAVLYLLTSTKKIEVTEKQNYTIVKKFIEQQPYIITEEYEETEPLGPPACGNTGMNFTISSPWMYIAANGSVICAFNLTNLESKEGTWEYMAYVRGVTGNRYAKKTVGANSTETFTFTFEPYVAITSTCGISPVSLPSMEKCYYPKETFYKVVTKTRNVTRYRNVTVEKEIPLYNETTVTKTVNRFFGFPMIDFGW